MQDRFRVLAELDRVIHEPGRLMVTALLSSIDWADFVFLMNETGMTTGNLATHLAKLEGAGYVEVTKQFRGKVPQTLCRLTPGGRAAFERYRKALKAAL